MTVLIELFVRTSLVSCLALVGFWISGTASRRVTIGRGAALLMLTLPITLGAGWSVRLPNPLPAVRALPGGETVWAAQAAPIWSWERIALFVWLGVATFALFLQLFHGRRLRSAWRAGRALDTLTQRELIVASETLKVARVAPAKLGRVQTPLVFGMLGKLLLPETFPCWPSGHRTLALFHEVAHLRSRDTVWAIVMRLVRTLYWWNPLVHAVAKRHRIDIELAADEAVFRSGVSPIEYANDLLTITANTRTMPVGACPLSGMGSLETRVRAAMRFASNPPKCGPAWLVLAFLGISAALTLCGFAERSVVFVSQQIPFSAQPSPKDPVKGRPTQTETPKQAKARTSKGPSNRPGITPSRKVARTARRPSNPFAVRQKVNQAFPKVKRSPDAFDPIRGGKPGNAFSKEGSEQAPAGGNPFAAAKETVAPNAFPNNQDPFKGG